MIKRRLAGAERRRGYEAERKTEKKLVQLV
jgi:hypothetical protein